MARGHVDNQPPLTRLELMRRYRGLKATAKRNSRYAAKRTRAGSGELDMHTPYTAIKRMHTP